MEISIIITNYKTRGLLKQCLKGIYLFPPSVSFEIIVVDNNSQDGSVEMVREQFPEVKVLASDQNLGFHKGNNLGIKESTGKYIVILNTDIAFLDNSLDKMFAYMELNTDVALIGPKLKNPDGSIQMSCMRFPTPMVPIYRRTFLGQLSFARKAVDSYLMTDFGHDKTQPVDWILGACIMVRRSAMNIAGLMDEDLFLYFGDVAWCKKFWQSGFKVIYFPNTDIIHYHKRESAQSGLLSKIFWIHIIDWMRYLKKYQKTNAVQKENG